MSFYWIVAVVVGSLMVFALNFIKMCSSVANLFALCPRHNEQCVNVLFIRLAMWATPQHWRLQSSGGGSTVIKMRLTKKWTNNSMVFGQSIESK